MGLRRPKSNKNPSIFSHEFVIQNHADIVSCVAMVFVIGLVFSATNPVVSLFIAMQHNVTVNDTDGVADNLSYYTYGIKDLFSVFFYLLICIVFHAVIQEYVLDKLNRRMHLSKVKHSKFNESGQLLTFYATSAIWGVDMIIKESYLTNISSLWEDYPHAKLPFIIKFYFILQLSYWIHCFPELYFQKVKKDEMSGRIQYAALYLIFIAAAYCLNFTRVALCMMVLHYTVEFLFHLSRLLYFAEKAEIANSGFMVWNVMFVLVRLGTITLAVLTFWYGLEQQTGEESINIADGNFNTHLVRISVLAGVCLLQAWMMWNFINFHLKRMRERSQLSVTSSKKSLSSLQKRKDRKSKGKRDDDDDDSTTPPGTPKLAENGTATRQRASKAKKAN